MMKVDKALCVICNARMVRRHLRTSNTGQTVCKAYYQCAKRLHRRSATRPSSDRPDAFDERIEALQKMFGDIGTKITILSKKIEKLSHEISQAKEGTVDT